MNRQYCVEVHRSVDGVEDHEWRKLIDPAGDLAMDQRLIRLLENTLSDQAQFWTIVVRDAQKQLIACACLSLFQTDIVQSVTGVLQKAIQRLRLRWPDALKLKVLLARLLQLLNTLLSIKEECFYKV